ncbi:MAG: single-stranded-DNA-specific exonuclease RecJ, partial [Myxococcota bacterium]
VRERLGPPPYVAEMHPDLEVDDRELSLRMVQELSLLEPFGQENPEPLLMARRMRVRDKRVVGGEHLKLSLGEAGHDAIGFGLGEHMDTLPDEVDVVFRVERNVFRGRESLQLRIDDLRPADE